MRWYKGDLHIHSVLSPCGDLEMSPSAVMKKAKSAGLDIIAITDHNSAANSEIYARAAAAFDICFIYGLEVQSVEEIHTIALFENSEQALSFSQELYESLLPIDNDPEYFGDQVIIDEQENITSFVSRALINSSSWSLETVWQKIQQKGGFWFPAHVDVESYSILGQLGFIPPNSGVEVLEITANCDKENLLRKHPDLSSYTYIRNSDAHYLKDIGRGYTSFLIQEPSLPELIKACRNQDGRKIL